MRRRCAPLQPLSATDRICFKFIMLSTRLRASTLGYGIGRSLFSSGLIKFFHFHAVKRNAKVQIWLIPLLRHQADFASKSSFNKTARFFCTTALLRRDRLSDPDAACDTTFRIFLQSQNWIGLRELSPFSFHRKTQIRRSKADKSSRPNFARKKLTVAFSEKSNRLVGKRI